jgi:hypothetical protein
MLQIFTASQKRFTYSYTFLMVWTLSVSASAELIDRAAVIEEINGSLNLFKVWRGGKKLPIFPLMVLQEGDKLDILKPEDTSLIKNQQTYIRLTFGGNQSEKVIYKKSPYLVKKRDTTPSIVENIAINTKTWFRSLYEHFYNTVETRTKGGELFSIRLLTEHKTQLFVAGQRVLHLGWQGGIEPYQVWVYQENLDQMVGPKKSDSKQVSFEGEWLPGYYQVIIHDEGGKKTIHGQFQVVTRSHPTHPKLSGQDAISTTLQAAWLAQQENGVWRLEAYQQVFDFAEEKYQPALVLKKGLEAGE